MKAIGKAFAFLIIVSVLLATLPIIVIFAGIGLLIYYAIKKIKVNRKE